MSKSITEQIDELQQENNRLKGLDKIVDKIFQSQVGMKRKEVEKALRNGAKATPFEEKIVTFFALKTEQDKEDFLSLLLTESTLNFLKERHNEE